MGLQEQETPSLAELDAADQAEVDRVAGIILEVVRSGRPNSISDLSQRVRERGGEIDNSVIRAALLRLLNQGELALAEADNAGL